MPRENKTNAAPRLIALGNVHLEPFGFAQAKPLLLLVYIALEGEQSRDHLRELFFPNASNSAASLRSTINRVRQVCPEAFEGTGLRLRTSVTCDASQVLYALEHQDLERAVTTYTASFLEDVEIPEVHPELLEWIQTMREYLARGVAEARVNLAERALENADVLGAREHLEMAQQIPGLKQLEPSLVQRLAALEAQLEFNLEIPKPKAIPNNLAQSMTTFIGRSRESQHILELLQEDARLVSLVGPGGVGKTRLALETARQTLQLEIFSDGVFMVMLEAITDLETLLSRIVLALKLSLKPDAPVLEQIIGGIADRRILLVLDNFEHLLEHAVHLTRLLEQCPNLRMIVTSRERLNLHSEWVTPLGGLSLISEQDAALELFLDRAARIGIHTLTPEEQNDALEICKLVHGFPLAIELAVPLLRALSLSELRADLGRNLDLLDNTLRDTPERHRSIRAVFEHSWKMLTPLEQHALAQLAVFRGGATREAIGAITATKLQTLASLTDKTLVQRDENTRFGIHPLLYQFTFQKLLELPDFEASFAHHSDYYLNKLEQDTSQIRRSNAANAMNNIEAELENIRAAWSHAIQYRQAARLEKVQDVVVFFDQRSRYAEGLMWFDEVIDVLEADPTQPLAFAGMLVGAAWLQYRLGRNQEARERAERAANLTRTMIDVGEEILSKALNTLGSIALANEEYRESLIFGEEAMEIAHKQGDLTREATCLINLANTERMLGLNQKAKNRYEKALSIAKSNKILNLEILVLLNLGDLFLSSEEYYDQSVFISLLEEGLLLSEKIGDPLTILHFYWLLSRFYFNSMNYEESERKAGIAYEKSLLINKFDAQAGIFFIQGRIAQAGNKINQARDYFLKGLNLAYKIDEVYLILDALIFLSDLAIQCDQKNLAIEYLQVVIQHPSLHKLQMKETQAVLKRLGLEQLDSRGIFSLETIVGKILNESSPSLI